MAGAHTGLPVLVVSHTHTPNGPECKYRTVAGCDRAYADAQADAQVRLAVWSVGQGYARYHKGEKALYSQVVRIMAGLRDDLMNDEGNPSQNPWAKRLRAAIERYRRIH